MREILDDAKKELPPPRERILAAVRDLFCSQGIKAVSVDEIAAAAQTNKMTLYRHFESKDQLIAAYVRLLSDEADAEWAELARKHPGDPYGQLRGWIRLVAGNLSEPDNRGCPLTNAAVEIADKDHPARPIIEAHKRHQRDHIATLCRETGFMVPEELADAIVLLLEGARVDIQSVGHDGPGARIADTIFTLLDTRPRIASQKADVRDRKRS
jgi:AcrR family transcriptional regulator